MDNRKRRYKAVKRRKIILISVFTLFIILSSIFAINVFYKFRNGTPLISKNEEEIVEISEDKLLSEATNNIQHNLKISKIKVALNKKKDIPEGVKLVAITFDDGPGGNSTQKILDTLEKYKAKGTWFVLGSKVESNPEMLKKIDKAGHEINSHTYDHPNLTLLSPEQVREQINTTNKLIYKAIKKTPSYLRPPYGEYNQMVIDNAGLGIAMWTIDSRDWESRDANISAQIVLDNVKSGDVILFHDIYDSTAGAVEIVVEELTKQGYTFVTFSELLSYR